MDTRVSLGLTKRAVGTLAADIEPFLRQIADRPRLVADPRQQLEWWAARLGHLQRETIATSDVRAALADLRKTHAASTCNHYRQALFSLYKTLDGRDAPNPVRDVAPFPNPAPEVPSSTRTPTSPRSAANVLATPPSASSATAAASPAGQHGAQDRAADPEAPRELRQERGELVRRIEDQASGVVPDRHRETP